MRRFLSLKKKKIGPSHYSFGLKQLGRSLKQQGKPKHASTVKKYQILHSPETWIEFRSAGSPCDISRDFYTDC